MLTRVALHMQGLNIWAAALAQINPVAAASSSIHVYNTAIAASMFLLAGLCSGVCLQQRRLSSGGSLVHHSTADSPLTTHPPKTITSSTASGREPQESLPSKCVGSGGAGVVVDARGQPRSLPGQHTH